VTRRVTRLKMRVCGSWVLMPHAITNMPTTKNGPSMMGRSYSCILGPFGWLRFYRKLRKLWRKIRLFSPPKAISNFSYVCLVSFFWCTAKPAFTFSNVLKMWSNSTPCVPVLKYSKCGHFSLSLLRRGGCNTHLRPISGLKRNLGTAALSPSMGIGELFKPNLMLCFA